MSGAGIASGFDDAGTFEADNLIAGEYPRAARIVTLTGQGTLTPGAVLGEISADGRYKLSEAASTDGSEIPDGILAEICDLNGTDIQALIYLTGEFNAQALVLGKGHTLESIRQAFRTRSIFLRSNQAFKE